jgi:serine/threonine-protein kinase
VKIADFGIAKIAGTNLTQTGLMMGTPAFMSPEQVSMGPVDSRSDLFSLGGMLYWMFTGQKPFPGESLTQITFKVVFGAPLPVAYVNPKLVPELDVVISRCLAKNPDDRYLTGRELAADLELVRAGKPLKTTLAPVSDITVMESNPLPVVAAGLPPGQRLPQTPLPYFTDSTVRVGSQQPGTPPQAAAQAATAGSVAPQAAPAAAPVKKSNFARLGVAAGVLVLAAAGYFLLQRKAPSAETPATTTAVSQPAPVQPQVNVPPPPGEPSKSPATGATQPAGAASPPKTEAAKKALAKPVAEKPAVGAKSSMQIECRHNFDEATLTITVDGKPLLTETLSNRKPLTLTRPVPAGQHKVAVHVVSEKAKFDQQAEIPGEFAADGTRSLVIEFGKFSGMGLRKPKLALKWGS